MLLFFFQAEDGIRDLVRSRGLGDVYKRQDLLRRHVGAEAGQLGGVHDGRLGGVVGRQNEADALSLIHI